MMTRTCALLMSVVLSGCFATMPLRAEQLHGPAFESESGRLTVVERNGTITRFEAPLKVRADAEALEVVPRLTPSARFVTAQVEKVELRAYDPKVTAINVGVTVGLVAATVAGIVGGILIWGANNRITAF